MSAAAWAASAPLVDGDGDLRLRQHRGIVDAVAGHGDDPAFLLQGFHGFQLVLRQHAAAGVFDAEFLRQARTFSTRSPE